jgi:hypothetical protein
MSFVDDLVHKARTFSVQLRRGDLAPVDKALVLAQRSLAAAGLDEHLSIGRHDIYQLEAPPPILRGSGDLAIRTASDSDLDGVCAVDDTPPALVLERLRRGDLLYLGARDGRVLCHVWFHRGPRPFIEDEAVLARWALKSTTFWCYGEAAVSAARASGDFVEVFQTALDDLFKLHGAERVQCRVARADSLSLLLHERLGFKRLGTFSGFSTPWIRSLVWTGPPARSFLIGPNSTRTLLLPP